MLSIEDLYKISEAFLTRKEFKELIKSQVRSRNFHVTKHHQLLTDLRRNIILTKLVPGEGKGKEEEEEREKEMEEREECGDEGGEERRKEVKRRRKGDGGEEEGGSDNFISEQKIFLKGPNFSLVLMKKFSVKERQFGI
jgi:hypothetical protein